jgi:hypothetical protein
MHSHENPKDSARFPLQGSPAKSGEFGSPSQPANAATICRYRAI